MKKMGIRAFQRSFIGKKGQSAIEYMLLLLVMVTLITSILTYVKNKYLGDPQRCQNTANSKTLLCKIQNFVKPTGGNKPFQYFPFKK